jgi:hypothetical protein
MINKYLKSGSLQLENTHSCHTDTNLFLYKLIRYIVIVHCPVT